MGGQKDIPPATGLPQLPGILTTVVSKLVSVSLTANSGVESSDKLFKTLCLQRDSTGASPPLLPFRCGLQLVFS